MSTINSKTAEGLFEFCDYMVEKGYATTNAMDAWKTATRKILSTVHGEESYGATDLTNIDFDDVLRRFETKTLGEYKPDSRVAYGRRMKNAIDAYLEFVDSGQPPKLRRPTRPASQERPDRRSHGERAASTATPTGPSATAELVEFPFPLQSGEMARLHLPRRLRVDDADRLSAFLRTLQLEAQKALPERTGEEAAAA